MPSKQQIEECCEKLFEIEMGLRAYAKKHDEDLDELIEVIRNGREEIKASIESEWT